MTQCMQCVQNVIIFQSKATLPSPSPAPSGECLHSCWPRLPAGLWLWRWSPCTGGTSSTAPIATANQHLELELCKHFYHSANSHVCSGPVNKKKTNIYLVSNGGNISHALDIRWELVYLLHKILHHLHMTLKGEKVQSLVNRGLTKFSETCYQSRFW